MLNVRPRRSDVLECVWLLFVATSSTLWCLTAAQALGATFDEPDYVQWGLEHWRTGSVQKLMKFGTMPLVVDLQTLPLFVWERWRGFPLDPTRDLEWALPWARAMTLLFWWTLLIYAWRAGRQLAGLWGGGLAATLLACEPIFLAHASLATSDVAVTACLLALFVEFQASRDRKWPRRIALPAVLFGIAILVKASGLAFGLIGLVAVELERAIKAGPPLQHWKSNLARLHKFLIPFWRDLAVIIAGGLAIVFIYCPEAGAGLSEQVRHNFGGHAAYLLGKAYRTGTWYYFPVAFTVKTSLFLLLLPVIVRLVHRGVLWNWATLGTVGLLLFSVTCRVQVGVRLMLPLLALGVVGLAAAAVHAWQGSQSQSKRIFLCAWIVGGIFSNSVVATKIWPEALCYTNIAWGGTRNGYRWLSDSNYDWGQGLKELRSWQEQRGVDAVDVWYFGRDPAVHRLPLRELPLHAPERLAGLSVSEAVKGKCVAVSATLLHGPYLSRSKSGREAVDFFRKLQPSDRTMTFFIYEFPR